MTIRKRATGANLNALKEDAMLRRILRAGLTQVEAEIKDAQAFGDLSDQVQLVYDRRTYIEKLLADDSKLSIAKL